MMEASLILSVSHSIYMPQECERLVSSHFWVITAFEVAMPASVPAAFFFPKENPRYLLFEAGLTIMPVDQKNFTQV